MIFFTNFVINNGGGKREKATPVNTTVNHGVPFYYNILSVSQKKKTANQSINYHSIKYYTLGRSKERCRGNRAGSGRWVDHCRSHSYPGINIIDNINSDEILLKYIQLAQF